jgi:hypothetical protein
MRPSALSLVLLAGVVALCVPAARVAAQEAALFEGDSVRVTVRGALEVEGVAVDIRDERLMLRTDGVANLWPVSMLDLDHLEVLRPRTNRQAFRDGFGLGLVTGLFVGAAVGLALHTLGVVGSDDDAPAERLIQTTLTGTGIGSVVGGFVGGIRGGRNPGMGWVSVRLPNVGRSPH